MTPFAIIADDLTGAADAAAPFAAAGVRTRLLLGEALGDLERSGVSAVSTGTRAAPAEQARRVVDATATELLRLGVRGLFKKVDSTLRGNIGVEVAALLDVLGPDSKAVVCPAFPATGRTVRGGRLEVDGAPLLATATARDELTPITSDRVADRFAGLATVTTVPLEVVHRGPEVVAAELQAAAARVATVDAVTDGDLCTIARAVELLPRPVLAAGAAGFSAAIARLHGPAEAAGRAPQPRRTERVLVVVGSRHERSREQLRRLRARPGVDHRVFDAGTLMRSGDRLSQADEVARSGAATVCLTTSLEDAADPSAVADGLADVVVRVGRARPCGLVVTGGDVAAAVLRRADASSVELVGEVAPGLPLGVVAGGSLTRHPIVTKAGAFGTSSALADAVDALTRTPQESHP